VLGHAGKHIFQEALAAGHMNGFFKLIQQFHTQAEPEFCGLSSLVQVMNALEVDPRRTWKGIWRWYSEDMLDCCKGLEDVKKVLLDQHL
jgi:glutathione gamma-glutamylcysteinyltransferase